MEYLRLEGEQVIYPYDLAKLRKVVSISDPPDARDLARLKVFHVHELQKPENKPGFVWEKEAAPVQSNGLWQIGWQQRPLNERELSEWRETLVVDAWKAKAVLDQGGHLAVAEAAVANAGGMIAMAWANAPTFSRTSAAIQKISTLLELDDDAIDDLFRQAAAIEI